MDQARVAKIGEQEEQQAAILSHQQLELLKL